MFRKMLLTILAGAAVNASASEIYFPYRPQWSVDQYLVFVLAHIPLQQLVIDPNSSVVGVTGQLYINVSNIPETILPAVQTAMKQALRGQRMVSGARFNTEKAMIRFSNELLQGSLSGDFIPELNLAVASAELSREKENGIVRALPDEETYVYDPDRAYKAQCEMVLNPHLHTFLHQ